MDRTIINSPIVTVTDKNTPAQPSTIAAGPTCPFTVPYDRLRIILAAADVAICCHNIDTNPNSEANVAIANASCETGRDGKGLMSRSLSSSSSAYQPGKLARSSMVRNAKGTAVYINPSKTISSLNFPQSKLNSEDPRYC